MKKILKGLLILLLIVMLSACKKDYKAITYTTFIENFKDESGYLVNDSSLNVDDMYERLIESSGKNNQFIFYEFKTEEKARKYAEVNYKNRKGFNYRDKKDYIIVKNNKDGYFQLIQIDKTIIVGNTAVKSNKKEIKRIFKKLGY